VTFISIFHLNEGRPKGAPRYSAKRLQISKTTTDLDKSWRVVALEKSEAGSDSGSGSTNKRSWQEVD